MSNKNMDIIKHRMNTASKKGQLLFGNTSALKGVTPDKMPGFYFIGDDPSIELVDEECKFSDYIYHYGLMGAVASFFCLQIVSQK